MNSWQQILAAYPIAQTIWDWLVIVAPLAALLAYSGLYFLSATARILAISRKRAAFDKCSRQLAMLALVLGWIIVTASRVWLYYEQPTHEEGGVENFLLEVSWLLFSMGVLLGTIFYSLWRILKNMPILHSTIGMICAVENCLALLVILFTIRVGAAAPTPEQSSFALPDLLPSRWDDPLLSALCYTLPLILAMPGAWGACWLLLRRRRDDFGRDYYNKMVSWCFGWARNAWLVLWLLLLTSIGMQVWQQMQAQIFDAQEALLDNMRIFLWLLPVLLWTAVRKGKPPLRHSWLLGIAWIIACLFMMPYYLELTLV